MNNKNRFILLLLSLSPAVAGFSSYLVNLLAAVLLNSVEEYSSYISFNSWANYFGAISTFCLVDMKLSPNSRLYPVLSLYFLAIISSTLIGIVSFIAILINPNISWDYLIIVFTGVFYFAVRNLISAALIRKLVLIPIGMRFLRAGLLMFFCLMLSIGAISNPTAFHFLVIQTLSAAIVFILYAYRLPRIKFSRILSVGKRVWHFDQTRFLRRNFSYLLDMAHMPFYYVAVGFIALNINFKDFVYIVGLIFPLTAMLNEVMAERFRLHFGIKSLHELRDQLERYYNFLFVALVFLISSTAFIIVFIIGIFDIPKNAVLGSCLLLHITLFFSTSVCGQIMSKAGCEVFDFTVNSLVTFGLILLINSGYEGVFVVEATSIILSLKYISQLVCCSFVLKK